MRWRSALLVLGTAVVGLSTMLAYQRPFRLYRSLEPYDNVELPPDWQERTEWVFARLMYPPHPNARFGRYRWGSADWHEGGTSWSQDYPRADRQFSMALRRLTRIHVRSVEQPVNPDDGDDIYNWPFLTAGEMGDWKLTDSQAAKIREYLLRGGFLLLDDFWGTEEWDRFYESMKLIFPDREIVDLENNEPIFHTVYDLDQRFQIPGDWAIRRGAMYRNDGAVPHWMGIFDDKKRLMVAIFFNSDVGDSWEWANDPSYPEKYSSLGIRLGVNYVVYALSH